jgi:MEMO1 family protein
MGSAAGKNVGDGGGSYRRRAHHAGSWYENDPRALSRTLQSYLDSAARDSKMTTSNIQLRALLCPHAGYSYSGPTAAYAYWHLQQVLEQQGSTPIEHILVLHPAHHVYLQGCAVSGASVLETPLGNLNVDDELRREILMLSPSFTIMDASMDNEEHSGEMQYPFIAKLLHSSSDQIASIPVLPIMCGALTTSQEASFGKLLAPIIARPNVVCVISSDFCHWGSRFRFQPTSNEMPIHQFIREMDHQGMDLIALQQPGAFADYLKTTKNTICGRHAISVWLQAVASHNGAQQQPQQTVKFVKYAQSSAVEDMQDSSVSYASAVVTLPTS